jgi:ADP-ribose pyrophosphatase YjhB (NUDIX family)
MKITVRALLFNEKNELLVVQHRKSNFWALPGGKIEESLKEDLKSCVIREMFEELGIKIKVKNLLFIHEFKWGKTKKDTEKNDVTTELFFLVKISENDANTQKISEMQFSGEFTEKELNKISWQILDKNLNIKPNFLKQYSYEKIIEMNNKNSTQYFSYI